MNKKNKADIKLNQETDQKDFVDNAIEIKHADYDISELHAIKKEIDDAIEEKLNSEGLTTEDANNTPETSEDDDINIKYVLRGAYILLKRSLIKHKKVYALILAIIIAIPLWIMAQNSLGHDSSKKAAEDINTPETTVVKALNAIRDFDSDTLKTLFIEFDETWLDALDMTTGLSKTEQLKNASNVSELDKAKSNLIKVLLPNKISNAKTVESETSKDSAYVSFSHQAVKVDDISEAIVTELFSASIKNAADDTNNPEKLVSSYAEAFKNISEKKYTQTTENATVEVIFDNGIWKIKDFKRFINIMIPDANFYQEETAE